MERPQRQSGSGNELKNDSPNQGRKRDAESGSKVDGAKGRELLAIPFSLCSKR